MLPLFSLVSLLSSLQSTSADTIYHNSSDYLSGKLGVGPVQEFRSSNATPPAWNHLISPNTSLDPGYIFYACRGPAVRQESPYIFDQNGSLVWDAAEDGFGPGFAFSMEMYQGKPHILMWQGEFIAMRGSGYVLLLDEHYDIVANFTTALDGPTFADFHEGRITSDDTVLLTAYQLVSDFDLSDFGGPESGFVFSGVAQEIDIRTGEPLFTWSAVDHVSPSECFEELGTSGRTPETAWDWFHINAVDKDSQGNYIIDSRHCSTVYYVSPSGDIIWKLGGKNSSFTMGEGTEFSYQHDPRWTNDEHTQLSLFNNDNVGESEQSSGLLLDLNYESMEVTLATRFNPYQPANKSLSQGCNRKQPNGDFLIGWGAQPRFSEYDSQGNLLWAVQFGVNTNVQSYRVLRYPWRGYPRTLPSVFVNNTAIYASWNGATEVDIWQVLGTDDDTCDGDPVAVVAAPRSGFETVIELPDDCGYVFYAVRAIAADGTVLGTSEFVRRS